MAPVLIKRYQNDKLYITSGNTEPVGYITLKDLVIIVQKGKDVKVIDPKGIDITDVVLKSALVHIKIDKTTLLELLRAE